MHLSQGLLALKLVLSGGSLHLELVDFRVDLGEVVNDTGDLVAAVPELSLGVGHLTSPILSQLLFLLGKLLHFLLKLPVKAVCLFFLHLELSVLGQEVFQLGLRVLKLIKDANTRGLNGLEQVLCLSL